MRTRARTAPRLSAHKVFSQLFRGIPQRLLDLRLRELEILAKFVKLSVRVCPRILNVFEADFLDLFIEVSHVGRPQMVGHQVEECVWFDRWWRGMLMSGFQVKVSVVRLVFQYFFQKVEQAVRRFFWSEEAWE